MSDEVPTGAEEDRDVVTHDGDQRDSEANADGPVEFTDFTGIVDDGSVCTTTDRSTDGYATSQHPSSTGAEDTRSDTAQETTLEADTNGLFFNEEGGRSTGPAITLSRQDKGLTSSVGFANRDGKGRELSAAQRQRANQLRCWQRRVQLYGSRERSLRTGLDEVNRMGSALGIDNTTRQVALKLFRQAADADLLIGRAIESIASGCLYASARQCGYPRSFDEIAQVSRVNRKRIVTAYKAIRSHFDLSLAPVDPAAYLDRFATACDTNPTITRTARDIIRTAQNKEGCGTSILGGASPTSIAAAALFAASNLNNGGLTQQAIAEAADVHVTTIRNNYSRLQQVYEQTQRVATGK